MLFVETSAFTRSLTTLLTDDEYAELQDDLIERPDLGAVIPEGGGIPSCVCPQKGVVKAAALV